MASFCQWGRKLRSGFAGRVLVRVGPLAGRLVLGDPTRRTTRRGGGSGETSGEGWGLYAPDVAVSGALERGILELFRTVQERSDGVASEVV